MTFISNCLINNKCNNISVDLEDKIEFIKNNKYNNKFYNYVFKKAKLMIVWNRNAWLKI